MKTDGNGLLLVASAKQRFIHTVCGALRCLAVPYTHLVNESYESGLFLDMFAGMPSGHSAAIAN